jgi:hypothetical protein
MGGKLSFTSSAQGTLFRMELACGPPGGEGDG